ncbi:MAG: transcription antitermination factor NusB [Marinilabiliaceae bacterium]|nr:transcription antitermination factor NusB [Marinilabiliaceae bacterium]
MLSRRLLRVKVMQVVYSHQQQTDNSYNGIEKELYHSIGKSHELYHLMLQLPMELRRMAEKRIEAGKSKINPTQEELNPNLRFVHNRLIFEIERNQQLAEYIEATKVTWTDDSELIKIIFNKMIASEAYKEYMNAEEDSFENDAHFVIKFITKLLPEYEFFFDALELKSIYWNDEAEFAISIAAKTLKQFDGHNGHEVPLIGMFKDADDETFVKKLLRATVEDKFNTISLIQEFSKNWDANRVSTIDNIIIRMAIAEMTSFHELPIRITLNEYIEIAKYYSTNKSNNYINGILQKIVTKLVEEKHILPAQLA